MCPSCEAWNVPPPPGCLVNGKPRRTAVRQGSPEGTKESGGENSLRVRDSTLEGRVAGSVIDCINFPACHGAQTKRDRGEGSAGATRGWVRYRKTGGGSEREKEWSTERGRRGRWLSRRFPLVARFGGKQHPSSLSRSRVRLSPSRPLSPAAGKRARRRETRRVPGAACRGDGVVGGRDGGRGMLRRRRVERTMRE